MKRYSSQEFAKLINKTTKTLTRWDKSGKLVAYRTENDYKYYTDTHLKLLQSNITNESVENPKYICYARVYDDDSTNDYVSEQLKIIEGYCKAKGIEIEESIKERSNHLNICDAKWQKYLADTQPYIIIVTNETRVSPKYFEYIRDNLKLSNIYIKTIDIYVYEEE